MKILSNSELLAYSLKDKFDSGELKLSQDDTTVERYLINHPECCSVYAYRNVMNLYGKLSGVRHVHLKYELSDSARQKRIGGGGSTHYEWDMEMSSCGEKLQIGDVGGFILKN